MEGYGLDIGVLSRGSNDSQNLDEPDKDTKLDEWQKYTLQQILIIFIAILAQISNQKKSYH